MRKRVLTAVPIRRGSGTRFKIVESASHGRPCVSTTIGAEGLLFRDEESILLRDSMADFAAACIRLLEDKALAERIGAAALAMARRDYDRDHAVALYRVRSKCAGPQPAASGSCASMTERARQFLFIGGTSEPGGLHIHTVDVAHALAAAGDQCCDPQYQHRLFQPADGGLAPSRSRRCRCPRQRRASPLFAAWRRLLAPYARLGDGSLPGHGRRYAAERRCSPSAAGRSASSPSSIGPLEREGVRGFWRRLRGRLVARLIRRAIAVSEETRLSAIAGGLSAAGQGAGLSQLGRSCLLPGAMRRPGKVGVVISTSRRMRLSLGFAGRLAPDKRVDVLIDAFAATRSGARDLRLVLIGDGWKKVELQQQCQALGLAERVIFRGWQGDTADGLRRSIFSSCPAWSRALRSACWKRWRPECSAWPMTWIPPGGHRRRQKRIAGRFHHRRWACGPRSSARSP